MGHMLLGNYGQYCILIKPDDRQDLIGTNIPGIYTSGDVAGGYKQIVTAAGHGAEAALTIFEDMINPYWT